MCLLLTRVSCAKASQLCAVQVALWECAASLRSSIPATTSPAVLALPQVRGYGSPPITEPSPGAGMCARTCSTRGTPTGCSATRACSGCSATRTTTRTPRGPTRHGHHMASSPSHPMHDGRFACAQAVHCRGHIVHRVQAGLQLWHWCRDCQSSCHDMSSASARKSRKA